MQIMLDENEAFAFIEKKLDVSNPRSKLSASKLDFLNLLIFRMQHTFPFQSVSLIAEDKDKRHRPCLSEIGESVSSGVGGLCYTLNVFMFFLLRGLGYKVFLNHCTVTSSVTYPDNHVVVIVKDVEQTGDIYLCETGVGHPTFQAICLNFDKESPTYNDSYLEYRYIKHDGKVMRMHGDGDFRRQSGLPFDFYVGKFRRFYELKLEPSDKLSAFDAQFDTVYTNKEATLFHVSLRALIFKDKRATVMVNSRLMLENDHRQFDITSLETDDSLREAYSTHFPALPSDIVAAAIANWRK
ncbi:uncharacterized protein [Haliotis asinina]|uniref:uncharacterized protein isoform X2 n=1 Tax=Haliotis asinina TaxID=109174 RepID=UPI003532222E